MSDHPYIRNCGCPGCQFLWAAEMCEAINGPPPIIGTFEPISGDVGRDYDGPNSPFRAFIGGRWWPYFEVMPRQHG